MRAYERSHRGGVRIVAADWLRACAREQRLQHHDDFPFTGSAAVRPWALSCRQHVHGARRPASKDSIFNVGTSNNVETGSKGTGL